jgi:hypothetical protein
VAVVLLLALSAGVAGCGEGRSGPEKGTPGPRPAGSPSDLRVGVDRRVELVSILFRLAGSPPYDRTMTGYAVAADEHFAPFRRHPAVSSTRALTTEYGISYDAPVELAAYLDRSLHEIRRLSPLPPGLDPRWRGVNVDGYLRKVRSFAAASRFDAFYRSQSDYHGAVEEAFRGYLAGRSVVDWFDAAFGRKRGASYRLVPGLLTGGFSFGTTAQRDDGGKEIAQVMFLEAPDSRGVPHPTTLSLEYVAHELAHSYVNPIFDARVNSMRASALPLFRRFARAMRAQAYTSYPIMVNESVVRAITILFLRDRAGEMDAQRSLAEQRELSFFWTPELVDAFDAQRRRKSGRLEPEALVRVTRQVFIEWQERNR